MALDHLMFSIRIVSVDSYMSDPVPGLDPCFSEFRKQDVKSVPVVRIFGSTPAGQTTCLHVHGIFPYLMIPYCGPDVMESHWTETERYMQQMALSLDSALNSASGKAKSTHQHVFKIELLRGIPFYGYHEEEELFLKVFFYLPGDIKRAAELLHAGAVMNRQFQPHEAHIPYILQLFMDYNLHGMNLLHAKNCWFRTPIGKPNPPNELPTIRRPDDHEPDKQVQQAVKPERDKKEDKRDTSNLAEKYHAPSVSQLGNFNWNLLRERACGGQTQQKTEDMAQEDSVITSSSRMTRTSPTKDDDSLPHPSLSCSNLCKSLMSGTFRSNDSSELADGVAACLCPIHTIWTRTAVPERFKLPDVVERLSTCEIEVDVLAPDIANRAELANASTGNPGLATIWEDERSRRRDRGQESQVTPDQSQIRPLSENMSEKEAHFVQMLYDALDRHKAENSQLATFSESMSFTATPASSLTRRRSSEDSFPPAATLLQDPARRESKDLFSPTPDSEIASPKSSAESLLPVVSQEVISQVLNASRNRTRLSQDPDALSSPDDNAALLSILTKLEQQDEEDSVLHPPVASQRSNGPLDNDNDISSQPEKTSISQQLMRRQTSFSTADSQNIQSSGSSGPATQPIAPPSDDEDAIENFEMSQRWDSAIQDLLHDLSDEDLEMTAYSSGNDDVIPQLDGASDDVPNSRGTKRLGSAKRCHASVASTSTVPDMNDNVPLTHKAAIKNDTSLEGATVKKNCDNIQQKSDDTIEKSDENKCSDRNDQRTEQAGEKQSTSKNRLVPETSEKDEIRESTNAKTGDKTKREMPVKADWCVAETEASISNETTVPKISDAASSQQCAPCGHDEFVSARTHPTLTGIKLDWKGCKHRPLAKHGRGSYTAGTHSYTKFNASRKAASTVGEDKDVTVSKSMHTKTPVTRKASNGSDVTGAIRSDCSNVSDGGMASATTTGNVTCRATTWHPSAEGTSISSAACSTSSCHGVVPVGAPKIEQRTNVFTAILNENPGFALYDKKQSSPQQYKHSAVINLDPAATGSNNIRGIDGAVVKIMSTPLEQSPDSTSKRRGRPPKSRTKVKESEASTRTRRPRCASRGSYVDDPLYDVGFDSSWSSEDEVLDIPNLTGTPNTRPKRTRSRPKRPQNRQRKRRKPKVIYKWIIVNRFKGMLNMGVRLWKIPPTKRVRLTPELLRIYGCYAPKKGEATAATPPPPIPSKPRPMGKRSKNRLAILCPFGPRHEDLVAEIKKKADKNSPNSSKGSDSEQSSRSAADSKTSEPKSDSEQCSISLKVSQKKCDFEQISNSEKFVKKSQLAVLEDVATIADVTQCTTSTSGRQHLEEKGGTTSMLQAQKSDVSPHAGACQQPLTDKPKDHLEQSGDVLKDLVAEVASSSVASESRLASLENLVLRVSSGSEVECTAQKDVAKSPVTKTHTDKDESKDAAGRNGTCGTTPDTMPHDATPPDVTAPITFNTDSAEPQPELPPQNTPASNIRLPTRNRRRVRKKQEAKAPATIKKPCVLPPRMPNGRFIKRSSLKVKETNTESVQAPLISSDDSKIKTDENKVVSDAGILAVPTGKLSSSAYDLDKIEPKSKGVEEGVKSTSSDLRQESSIVQEKRSDGVEARNVEKAEKEQVKIVPTADKSVVPLTQNKPSNVDTAIRIKSNISPFNEPSTKSKVVTVRKMSDPIVKVKSKKSDGKKRIEKLKKEAKKKKKARSLSLSPKSEEDTVPAKSIVPVCSRTVEPISTKIVPTPEPDSPGAPLTAFGAAESPDANAVPMMFERPSLDLVSPGGDPTDSSPEIAGVSEAESVQSISPTKSTKKKVTAKSVTKRAYPPLKKVTRRSVAVKLHSILAPECMFSISNDDSREPFPQIGVLAKICFPSPFREEPLEDADPPRPWSPKISNPQDTETEEANDLLEQFANSFGSAATKMLDIDPESVFKNMDCIDELMNEDDVHLGDVHPEPDAHTAKKSVDASGKDLSNDRLLKHFDAILEDVSSAATSKKDLCKPETSHLGDLEEETLMDLIDEMTSPDLPRDSSLSQHSLASTVQLTQPSPLQGVDEASSEDRQRSSCFFSPGPPSRSGTPCLVPTGRRFESGRQSVGPGTAFSIDKHAMSSFSQLPPRHPMNKGASFEIGPEVARAQSVQSHRPRNSYPPPGKYDRPNSVSVFRHPVTLDHTHVAHFPPGRGPNVANIISQQVQNVRNSPARNFERVVPGDKTMPFSHSQQSFFYRGQTEVRTDVPSPSPYRQAQSLATKDAPADCLYTRSNSAMSQPLPGPFPTYTPTPNHTGFRFEPREQMGASPLPRPASVAEPLQVFHTHVHHHHHVHSIKDPVTDEVTGVPSRTGGQFSRDVSVANVKTEAVRNLKTEKAGTTPWPKHGSGVKRDVLSQPERMRLERDFASAQKFTSSAPPMHSNLSSTVLPTMGPMLTPPVQCVTQAANLQAQQTQFLCPSEGGAGSQGHSGAVLCQTTSVMTQKCLYFADAPSVLLKGSCTPPLVRPSASVTQKNRPRAKKTQGKKKSKKGSSPDPLENVPASGSKSVKAKTPYGIMKQYSKQYSNAASKSKAKLVSMSDRKRKSVADFRVAPPNTPTISLTSGTNQGRSMSMADTVDAFDISQDMFDDPPNTPTEHTPTPKNAVYSTFTFSVDSKKPASSSSLVKRSGKGKVAQKQTSSTLQQTTAVKHVDKNDAKTSLIPKYGEELVLSCVTGEWEVVKVSTASEDVPVLFHPEEQTLGSSFSAVEQVNLAAKKRRFSNTLHHLQSESTGVHAGSKRKSKDEDLKQKKRSKSVLHTGKPCSKPEYVVAVVDLNSESPKLKLTLKKNPAIPLRGKPEMADLARASDTANSDRVELEKETINSDESSDAGSVSSRRKRPMRRNSDSDSDFRIDDASESTEDASELEDFFEADEFDMNKHLHQVQNMYVLNKKITPISLLPTISEGQVESALDVLNANIGRLRPKKSTRPTPNKNGGTSSTVPAVHPDSTGADTNMESALKDNGDSVSTGSGLPDYDFYDSTTTFFQGRSKSPVAIVDSSASSPCSVEFGKEVANKDNQCEGSVCSVPPIKIIRLAKKLSSQGGAVQEFSNTSYTLQNVTSQQILPESEGVIDDQRPAATERLSEFDPGDVAVVKKLLDKLCTVAALRADSEKLTVSRVESRKRISTTVDDIKRQLSLPNLTTCVGFVTNASLNTCVTLRCRSRSHDSVSVPMMTCGVETRKSAAVRKAAGSRKKKVDKSIKEQLDEDGEDARDRDAHGPPSPTAKLDGKTASGIRRGTYTYKPDHPPPDRDTVARDVKAAGLNSETSKVPFYGESADAQATSHRLSNLPPYIKKPKPLKSAFALQEYHSVLSDEGGLRHRMVLVAASAQHTPSENAVLRQKAAVLLPANVHIWDSLDAVSKLPEHPVLTKIFLPQRKITLRPAKPPPSRDCVVEWLNSKRKKEVVMKKIAIPLKGGLIPDHTPTSNTLKMGTQPTLTPGVLKRSVSLTPAPSMAKTPRSRRVSFDLSNLTPGMPRTPSPIQAGLLSSRKRKTEKGGSASIQCGLSEGDSGLCSPTSPSGEADQNETLKDLPFASLTSPIPKAARSANEWDTSMPFETSPYSLPSVKRSEGTTEGSSAIKTLVGSSDADKSSPVTLLLSGTFTPIDSSRKKLKPFSGAVGEGSGHDDHMQSTPNATRRKPALRKLAFTPIQVGIGPELTPIKESVSPLKTTHARDPPCQGTPSTTKGTSLRKTVLAKRFSDPTSSQEAVEKKNATQSADGAMEQNSPLLQSRLSLDSPQAMLRKEGSQILGPTLNNTYGFKAEQQHLGDAKSLHIVQHIKTLSVELHVKTRIDLRPDPDMDEIRCLFYCLNSDAWAGTSDSMKTGIIIVDADSVSEDGVPDSEQPSTSRSTPTSAVDLKRKLIARSGVSRIDTTYVKTEDDLFLTFARLVHDWDPDILIGYEVQMLSWGFLLQRAAHLRWDLCRAISRVPVDQRGNRHEASKDAYGADNASELHVVGRIVLNLWRLMRTEVALYDYSFESVAYHLLHERYPCYSHQTLTNWYEPPARGANARPSDIHRWRVLDFYTSRVRANLRLLAQQDLTGRTSELARIFGIQFYEVLTRGTQFRVESMLLRAARLRNLVAVTPSVLQRAQMRAPEVIALVMEPESKFYHVPVLVLDFQSLYPTMVIAYNLCYSTCLGKVDVLGSGDNFNFGCTSLCVPPKTLSKLLRKNLVTITPSGVVFVKPEVRRGVMPQMLDEILTTRIMVKNSMKKCGPADAATKRMLDHRQLGLKLIANVTYGYTAANFSGRMPSVELGDSIVHKARETLERAIQLVTSNSERWENARVVYGDTDSMFIALEGVNNTGCSKSRAFEVGKEIAAAVTGDNPTPVKLKFEKVYLPCVLQTKKRYVGYSYESEDQAEPIFDAKGIETVRRDGTPATAKILEKMLRILFESRDVSKVKKYVVKQCSKILDGRTALQDCIIAKEYRGRQYYKPGAVVPALGIARKMLAMDRRAEPRVGERVPYVIVHGAPGTPLYQLVRSPLEVLNDTSLQLNGAYYVLKHVLPALDRVLSLLGVDVFLWHRELPRTVNVSNCRQDSSQNLVGKKATISHFFKSKHCLACQRLSVKSICDDCLSSNIRKQKTVIELTGEAMALEKRKTVIEKMCMQCAGAETSDMIRCVSLDCPILYKYHRASDEASKARTLRKALAAECLF